MTDPRPISALTIDNNLAGNGACTYNIDNKPDTTLTGVTITNNQFNRDSTYNCATIISTPITPRITNNTWTNTTTPATLIWR